MKRMIEKTASELEVLAVPALRRCLKRFGDQDYIDELARICNLLSIRSMEENREAVRLWHEAKDHHENLDMRRFHTERGYVAPDWTPPTDAELAEAKRLADEAYERMNRSFDEASRAQSLGLDTWEILVDEWQRRKRTKTYPHQSAASRARLAEDLNEHKAAQSKTAT